VNLSLDNVLGWIIAFSLRFLGAVVLVAGKLADVREAGRMVVGLPFDFDLNVMCHPVSQHMLEMHQTLGVVFSTDQLACLDGLSRLDRGLQWRRS
jgi:hypothetical protein